jgi:hypothetical protein
MTKEEIEELPEYIKDDMKLSHEYHVRFLAPRGTSELPNYPTEASEGLNPDETPF